jgi:hypothetical protein
LNKHLVIGLLIQNKNSNPTSLNLYDSPQSVPPRVSLAFQIKAFSILLPHTENEGPLPPCERFLSRRPCCRDSALDVLFGSGGELHLEYNKRHMEYHGHQLDR